MLHPANPHLFGGGEGQVLITFNTRKQDPPTGQLEYRRVSLLQGQHKPLFIAFIILYDQQGLNLEDENSGHLVQHLSRSRVLPRLPRLLGGGGGLIFNEHLITFKTRFICLSVLKILSVV